MKIIEGLFYSKNHEWVKVDGDKAYIGITDYAQESMGDIVFLELPEVDDQFDPDDSFAVVESVKAAADVYLPVSGEITATNEDLADSPELINSDPYGEAWMYKIKLSDPSEVNDLLDVAGYQALADEH